MTNQTPNDFDEDLLRTHRKDAAKKQAKKWFIILISIGLIIGAVVSVGIVQVLDHFGLTDNPSKPLLEQLQE